MVVCGAITRAGSRCTASVKEGKSWCYNHDPALSEQRRLSASKAGRSKPNRELADIKSRLSKLATDVLEGKVNTGRAAVASQVLNTYIRAISVELKVREVDELAREVEELRELVETREKGNSQWRYGG